MIRMYSVLLAALLAISGCGTINTVFRPDAVASQNLKESRSYCENIPRIYSGVIYGFCTLNAEPAPEKSLNDRALSDHENNAFPIIAIEFIVGLEFVFWIYYVFRHVHFRGGGARNITRRGIRIAQGSQYMAENLK